MTIKHDSSNNGRMMAPLSDARRSNGKPALEGDPLSAIVTTRAWESASESQRWEWSLAVLETLRDAYGELRLEDRLKVKRALADARAEAL